MSYIKPILKGRAMLGASIPRILRNAFALQPYRKITTQETELASSLSSSSPSKYRHLFPSCCREDIFSSIDFFASTGRPYYNDRLPTKPDHRFEPEPHYTSDDFNHIKPIRIQKGRRLDVISLLSTHGDQLIRIGSDSIVKVTDLRGKYVLVICAFVPTFWSDSHAFWGISMLLSEMFRTHGGWLDNFEVVVVPKMRRNWENNESVFRHFMSAFPNCLAVPCTDNYRCDYICKSLNFDGEPEFVYVDPTQKVLQVDCSPIVAYGARGFPFTDEHLKPLRSRVNWDVPTSPPIKSLPELLCCESNPSSVVLTKFDSEETISVQQLNKHYVVLYLFNKGNLLKDVKYIYQQCRDRDLDLEIALVCMPFTTKSIDPEVYQDIVCSVLKKHHVSNWWVFRYNNSVCRWLYKLSEYARSDFIFMVGPDNKFVNRHAGVVFGYFGQHFGSEVYPFTMTALVHAFLQRMEKITLESFFTRDYLYLDYECDDTKTIPVSALRGKNVLVYVTSSWRLDLEINEVSEFADKIKEKDPDFEAVLVPVEYFVSDAMYQECISTAREYILKSRTKLLVCPFDDRKQSRYLETHDAFLFKAGPDKAIMGMNFPAELAFGKDGRLVSTQALSIIEDNGIDAYPLVPKTGNQILRDEISLQLGGEFEDFWNIRSLLAVEEKQADSVKK